MSGWDRIAPIAKLLASVSSVNDFVGSACTRIGAEVKAFFNLANASSCSERHWKGTSLRVKVLKRTNNGRKILNKTTIKVSKTQKGLNGFNICRGRPINNSFNFGRIH